jgi:hypothetical protein
MSSSMSFFTGRYTGATTDYIEEKGKTEELLYELLPRYILYTGATTDYLEEKGKTEELLYELLPRYIQYTGATTESQTT